MPTEDQPTSTPVSANTQAPPPAVVPSSARDVEESGGRKPWFDWSDRDQVVLLGLGLLVLVAIGYHWGRWRARGVEVVDIERLPLRQYDFRIEINHATWVEWMQLPDVGEILARRIISNRDERGPFTSIEDVGRVPGIGTVTFDTIRPWLVCSDCKTGTTH